MCYKHGVLNTVQNFKPVQTLRGNRLSFELRASRTSDTKHEERKPNIRTEYRRQVQRRRAMAFPMPCAALVTISHLGIIGGHCCAGHVDAGHKTEMNPFWTIQLQHTTSHSARAGAAKHVHERRPHISTDYRRHRCLPFRVHCLDGEEEEH